MSEQETNGTEEAPAEVVHDYSPEELGEIPNEGTDTAAVPVTLLGKILFELEGNGEVIGFVASPGAEWVKEPPEELVHGEIAEFDISDLITEGDEMTGTIHLAGDINLFFDMNGEDNAAHDSAPLGVVIRSQITQGPNAVAEWVISPAVES